MKKLNNIHPGEILQEEFLIPLKISAYKLSKDINIPQTRISEILKGKRRITADTALRLSNYFVIRQNFGWDFRMTLILRRRSLLKKTNTRLSRNLKKTWPNERASPRP
jgi:addiction module HigA family antidote